MSDVMHKHKRDWTIVAGLLIFAIVAAIVVNRYSNRFEAALISESNGKHHLISELVTTLASLEQDVRASESGHGSGRLGSGRLEAITSSLRKANDLVDNRLREHSFTENSAYSEALGITEPLMNDLQAWLSEGIGGRNWSDPLVLRVASQRIYLIKVQLQKAEFAANQRTLRLLHQQSSQIRTFGKTVNFLIAGLAALMVWAWLLYAKNQRDTARLWHERKLTSDSINNINEGFVLTEKTGKVVVINETLPKLSAPLAEALQSKPYHLAISDTVASGDLILHQGTHDQGNDASNEQQEYETAEGLFLRVTNRETAGGGRVVTFTNITDLKDTQEKLHLQANYDYLTGIANRSYYVERLSEALAGARRHGHKVALMQFDLDKFKQVNDTLGHTVGDELLITTAHRIKRNLREVDLAARIGGDEFAAILDRVNGEEEVLATAERIIKELRQELEIDGAQIDFSASIGIAMFPDHATDIEALIKHADIACYRAKDSGRNNFQLYGDDMKVQALELMTLETKLRKAIERDDLFLNYQPQLNINDQSLNMVEAFSRWQDSKLGNVSPDRFIPVADKNGLIARLGEQVLEKSFAQLRAWDEKGISDITVAVNISKRQLFLPTFEETIDRFSSRYEVPQDKLALEVTEDVISDDWRVAAEKLDSLAQRGIKIIIDDYGVGTSSLSRINELPIYALKIDGEFTKKLEVDSSAFNIVSAIISSAVNLKIKTIAENVETVEQMELLKSVGCSAIQGYLVGAPQSGDEIVTSYITIREKQKLRKAG